MSNVAKNSFIVLLSVVFTISLAEVALWAVGYNRPIVYAYAPFMGTTLRPNLAGWVKTEATAFVRTDANGLRVARDETGTPYPVSKPLGVFRIAVIGDSFVESHQVEHAESFPSLLEHKLSGCNGFGPRVEVLNFGVSGYNTVQALMALRHRALAYDPDIVLLLFHANNDLGGNYRKLERNPLIPYAEFKSGKLLIDTSFNDSELFRQKLKYSNLRNSISNQSRVLQLATNAYGAWFYRHSINREKENPVNEQPGINTSKGSDQVRITLGSGFSFSSKQRDSYFHPDFKVGTLQAPKEYLPPSNAFQEMLWELAEGVIELAVAETHATGAKFWMAATATEVAISPDTKERAAFLARHGVETTNYATERLAQFAEKNRVQFVPLAGPMLRAALRTQKRFDFYPEAKLFGHWNAAGHQVVGTTLARALCDRRE